MKLFLGYGSFERNILICALIKFSVVVNVRNKQKELGKNPRPGKLMSNLRKCLIYKLQPQIHDYYKGKKKHARQIVGKEPPLIPITKIRIGRREKKLVKK